MTDNPPAFPRDHRHNGHNGLSTWEYYAGQALAGICANPNFFGSFFQQSPEAAADFAAKAATAMLAERAKQ